jgi:predicted N-acetyltransferase YhbS
MSANVTTRPVTAADHARISALHARVFGPGRFVRSAYRVREGKGVSSGFCRVAELGTRLVAAVRITEVAIGNTPGAALLGPLAVDPDFAGQGFGRRLVAEALEEMKQRGVKIVILVGDEPYYGRFGFKPVPPGQIVFPGPVNPQRILAAELTGDALVLYRGSVAAAPPGVSGKS